MMNLIIDWLLAFIYLMLITHVLLTPIYLLIWKYHIALAIWAVLTVQTIVFITFIIVGGDDA